MNVDAQLQSLQQKITLLLKNQQQLLKSYVQTQKELDKANEVIAQQQNHIATLEQKIAALQLQNPSADNVEKQLLEKRIDGYLKEIEKCLTLLNT
jgi:ABC-type transporter Mla subunit MlaD